MEITGVINGKLFAMPYGDVGAAFGINARQDRVDHAPGEIIRRNDIFGDTSRVEGIDNGKRTTLGIFGEVELPLLVRDEYWAEAVLLNLSGRYTRESKFDNFSYKASALFQVTPALGLRASYSTSFRVPDLFSTDRKPLQEFSDDITANPFIDPCYDYGLGAPNDIIKDNCRALGLPPDFSPQVTPQIRQGPNPDLQPETGKSIVLGAVLSPGQSNLRFSIDYFDIQLENTIFSQSAVSILNRCLNSVNMSSGYCNPSILGPRVQSGPNNGALTFIDARDRNAGKSSVRGIDFLLTGGFDVGNYYFGFNGEASRLLSRSTQELANTPEKELKGAIGYAKWKANLNVFLNYKALSFTYGIRFIGAQDEAVLDPKFFETARGRTMITKIEPYLYHSFSAGYAISEKLNIDLTITNLLDKEPPVLSELPFTSDSRALRSGNVPHGAGYDILGPTLSLTFRSGF